MIQRKQSLYLLLAAAFAGAMLLLPLATFYMPEHCVLSAFSFDGAADPQNPVTITNTLWLGSILSLAALTPLINIFIFRNRRLQLRLCDVESVLLLAAAGVLAYYIYLFTLSIFLEAWRINCASSFVLVAAIFNLLARRGIYRDIKVLRSIDRIR